MSSANGKSVSSGRSKQGQHRQSAKGKAANNILAASLPTISETRSKNGHDARGRFTKGSKAGRGSSFARREGRLYAAALEAVTEDDMRAVIRKVVEQAKAGDLAGLKWLRAFVPSFTQAKRSDWNEQQRERLGKEIAALKAQLRRIMSGREKP